jgi:proteasome alpha subunit
MYRLSYDGTIVDEPQFLVMGGQAEALTSSLRQTFTAGLPLRDALRVAVSALGSVGGNGSARDLPATQLEVAVLDRTRANRKFRRYVGAALTELLPAATAEQAAVPAPADTPPHDVALEQPADQSAGGSAS